MSNTTQIDSSTESLVRIEGIDVQVRRKGDGPTLLFLHGGGGVPGWLPFFELLSRDFDVVVPDHPGFGASGDAIGIRSMGDLAFFYRELIDTLGLGSIRVVGSSLGAWLAAEIALRDLSGLHSLTLIAPLGLKVPGEPFGDIFNWSREEAMRRLFTDPQYAQGALEPLTPEMAKAEMRSRDTAIAISGKPVFESPDLDRWAHRLRLPVQLVWGEGDELVPPQHAGAWERRLPDVRVARIPECGHLPYIEQTARTHAIVADFLGVAKS